MIRAKGSDANRPDAESKKYEAALEEISQAERVGAITAMEAAAARERAGLAMVPTIDAVQRLDSGFAGLSSGKIQQAAFQLGDFAVQVGSGQSATVALAQQLPQLLGDFGAIGAVLGAGVAIGVPLLAAAFKLAGSEGATLDDRLKDLDASMRRAREITDLTSGSQTELAAKFAGTAAGVQVLTGALRDAELKHLNEVIQKTGESAFRGISDAITRIKGEFEALGLTFSPSDAINQLSLELSLSVDRTKSLVDAMDRYNQAATSPERNAVMLDTVDMFSQWRESLAGLSPEAAKVGHEFLNPSK